MNRQCLSSGDDLLLMTVMRSRISMRRIGRECAAVADSAVGRAAKASALIVVAFWFHLLAKQKVEMALVLVDDAQDWWMN